MRLPKFLRRQLAHYLRRPVRILFAPPSPRFVYLEMARRL